MNIEKSITEPISLAISSSVDGFWGGTSQSVAHIITRYIADLDLMLNSHLVFVKPVVLTGDFEFEFSLVTTVTGYEGLFVGDGFAVRMQLGKLQFVVDGTFIVSNSSVNDGAENKPKLIRSGNTYYLYVNGVLDKTGTVGTGSISIDTVGFNGSSYIDANIMNIKATDLSGVEPDVTFFPVGNDGSSDIEYSKGASFGGELLSNIASDWNQVSGDLTQDGDTLSGEIINGSTMDFRYTLQSVEAGDCIILDIELSDYVNIHWFVVSGIGVDNLDLLRDEGSYRLVTQTLSDNPVIRVRAFVSSDTASANFKMSVNKLNGNALRYVNIPPDNREKFTFDEVSQKLVGVRNVASTPANIGSYWIDEGGNTYTFASSGTNFSSLYFAEATIGHTYNVSFTSVRISEFDSLRNWGSLAREILNESDGEPFDYDYEAICNNANFPNFARNGGQGTFTQTVENLNVRRVINIAPQAE